MANEFKPCSIDGCKNPTGVSGSAKGWCRPHYKRWRAHGDPLGGTAYNGEPKRWAKEMATADHGDECLIWPFAIGGHGYGVLRTSGGKYRPAYNYMCELAHGPKPVGKREAAHSCGNKPCVNPKHLRWATNSENSMDKHDHGTMLRGSDVKVSKLTEANVLEIRRLLNLMKQVEIAAVFGVNPSTISDIYRKKKWAWLK